MTFGQWSRAYFRGNRYKIMTTGVGGRGGKSINGTLNEARSYPLIALLDAVQHMMSTWFHKHRQESSSCYNSVTPRVQILLRERLITAKHMNAIA